MSSSPPPAAGPPSDAALLDRCASGDESALGELYDRFAAGLYGLALRITGERADAEEVVLDVFAQVWREAGRFNPDRGSPGAWFGTLTRSRALDLLRARSRRGRLRAAVERVAPDQVPVLPAAVTGPEETVDLAERSVQVRAALAGLPEPQRAVIELAYFGGLSQSEIAAELGEPLGTVKTRVRAGMQKLREALQPFMLGAET
jgi:RNA polymerase sigma-70 factor (ECF subfamily)